MEDFGFSLVMTNPRVGYERCCEAAVRAGVKMVQLRMKEVPREELLDMAKRLVSITKGSATNLIVDDGGDLMLCDGLVRSVLFKSCLKAIDKAVFELPDEHKYEPLRKLRFISGESRTAENIDSFLNGCENCKHNK